MMSGCEYIINILYFPSLKILCINFLHNFTLNLYTVYPGYLVMKIYFIVLKKYNLPKKIIRIILDFRISFFLNLKPFKKEMKIFPNKMLKLSKYFFQIMD